MAMEPRPDREGVTRRALLAAGAAAGAGVLIRPRPVEARTAGARPALGGGWRMAHHDLLGWRRGADGPRDLAERWRISLAGGVPGAPAVAGNRVYAASFGGEVAACRIESGRELWRRALPVPVYTGPAGEDVPMAFFGGPAVAAGRLAVASDRVYCLDRGSGETLWESEPLRSPESDDYFWAPPVIVGGMVLVGSGSGSEGGGRGRLSAYDLRHGGLRWSTPTVPAGANGGGIIAPVTVDRRRGLAYVGTGAPYDAVPGANPGTSSILALRLRDGAIAWSDQVHAHEELGRDVVNAVLVGERLLVAAAKDGFYAWDRVRRRRLWHVQLTPAQSQPGTPSGPTNGPEWGPVACDGRRLYVLSNDEGSGQHVAAALEPRTGAVLWRRRLSGFSFAPPAVASGRVHASSSDGELRALRADDGEIASVGPLGEPSAGSVSAARGHALVGTGAGEHLPGAHVVCFAPASRGGGGRS
jgi:outer membrane protein assembly factor BamB